MQQRNQLYVLILLNSEEFEFDSCDAWLPTDDESRQAAHSCRSRRDNIDRLQAELKSMENQAVSVQQQIDSCVTELGVCDITC